MPEKWKLEGTLFDACNCTTLCPCVYGQAPNNPDCRPTAVWHINQGTYGQTRLNGLHFAGVIWSNGNPLKGIDKMAVIVDEAANAAQREALLNILGGKAGGFFAMLGSLVKENLGLTFARFTYSNDEKTWSVKAGAALDIEASFVKAPPGMPFDSKPLHAQTYDPLFMPTMEKVVGTTQKYKANVGGLSYDITGKYSSAGRFVYKGP